MVMRSDNEPKMTGVIDVKPKQLHEIAQGRTFDVEPRASNGPITHQIVAIKRQRSS
jgi:hypothetical protein